MIENKYIHGYLTVYVALSMTILISLCLALIEGARSNAIRMEAEIIMEVGLNSILAEYHRALFEQYNLFYIDSSYGTSETSWKKTQDHLTYYLEKNCDINDVTLGQSKYRNFLGMTVNEVKIQGLALATDNGGSFFRKRAIEAIQNDIGLETLEEVIKWIDVVEGKGWDKSNLELEQSKINEQIDEHINEQRELSELQWDNTEVPDFIKRLEQKRTTGILNLVIDDTSEVSQAEVDLSTLCYERLQKGILNAGNVDIEKTSTSEKMNTEIIERFLFQEYILRYGNYYGKILDKGVLKYQIEYLISGKNNDIENLKSVVYRISAIREAANSAYLFMDEVKCAEAEAAAALIATVMLVPEITPLLKVSILLGWAYAESLYDVKVLLAGGKVPLIKNAENWHYDIEGVLNPNDVEENIGWNNGLTYDDYLRILLVLMNLELQTFRFLNIIEMDIRNTPGSIGFRMDGCIDYIQASATFTSTYGYEYYIVRKKEY